MFLKRILDLIEKKGISKNKLLMDLQLSKNSFVNWSERGTVPSADTVCKIADYLDCSVDYLLGRVDIINDNYLKAEKQYTADTYKIMLSHNGVDVIKSYLSEFLENPDAAVWDKFKDIGLDVTDLKAALTTNDALSNKLFSKLDEVLLVMDTNFYDIFKQYFDKTENSLADYEDIAAEGQIENN